MAHYFSSCEEMILVDDCEPNSVVVYDYCVNIQQQEQNVKDYLVRGCHKNISYIFLTQSYTKTYKQLIRNNINFSCIFRQGPKYIRDIYDEYVDSDFTFKIFTEICSLCWKEDNGFLTFDSMKKLKGG
jgi:hypothetical protein